MLNSQTSRTPAMRSCASSMQVYLCMHLDLDLELTSFEATAKSGLVWVCLKHAISPLHATLHAPPLSDPAERSAALIALVHYADTHVTCL